MRKKFTTTIDEDILKKIKIQAITEDLDVSRFIEKLFEQYMDSLNKDKKINK